MLKYKLISSTQYEFEKILNEHVNDGYSLVGQLQVNIEEVYDSYKRPERIYSILVAKTFEK